MQQDASNEECAMSIGRDPLEKKARDLVTASSILSISLYRVFEQKNVGIERNFDNWEFFGTVAGVLLWHRWVLRLQCLDRNRYDSWTD